MANMLSAQTQGGSSNMLLYGVVATCAILVIWAMLGLASNLMKIEAGKNGLDPEKENYGVFPGLNDLFKAKRPSYAVGGTFHKFDKGFDINLEGKATGPIQEANVTRFAIKPTDFNGMSPIPKVTVEVGDEVKAGDVIFFDKKRPEINYVSPVSGEVVAVNRGEKRSIADVVVLADKNISYKKFNTPDIQAADRTTLVNFLAESGVWPLINERPFDLVPALDTIPVNIFISTFDTAPLAPDANIVISGNESAFQKGLDVLARLTSGSVHLGLDARGETAPSNAFVNSENVKKHWFSGPHPAGNVGVQIHHTAPIKGSDKVWTLGVQDVITLGNLFLTGEYRADRVFALTGGELHTPKYVKTYQGASVADLVKGNKKDGENRLISGDVLSGKQIDGESFLGFKDDQLTVIKEGNDYELFGWLLPLSPRPSISGTIPSFGKDHEFEANTNTRGEKRAFVVTGQYESVLPMDIYPQHLMKAIITNDFEKMEGLGITELTEEDIALCEFVCTSKNPLQSILRQGLIAVQEQS
jgi:Na+-transporting NADH:ubiquinone oxidoreductase subunit A